MDDSERQRKVCEAVNAWAGDKLTTSESHSSGAGNLTPGSRERKELTFGLSGRNIVQVDAEKVRAVQECVLGFKRMREAERWT